MKLTLAIVSVLALSGCVDMLSDSRILDSTALVLDQPVSAITIYGRRGDGPMNTYYIAGTPKGSYGCTIKESITTIEVPECWPLGSTTPASRHRPKHQAAG